MMPGVPKAKVKSRVILTPQHAKRLMKLTDNITKYEDQFGEISDVDPNKGIPLNFGGPTAHSLSISVWVGIFLRIIGQTH